MAALLCDSYVIFLLKLQRDNWRLDLQASEFFGHWYLVVKCSLTVDTDAASSVVTYRPSTLC